VKVRHEARIAAVQFLFQRDFNRDDLERALADFWESRRGSGAIRRFADELIRGVEACRADLDARIGRYAQNWEIGRMAATDRNVMRVALFEMLHRPDIPPVVSINEAVDVAKDFSGAESGRFVNGILDRARKDIDRPARSPAASIPGDPAP
jgi:N utilization substance protein B